MTESPKLAAIVYDFDGTLAQGNIQEHSFIPEVGLSTQEFWGQVKDLARENDADEILMYMWHMIQAAKAKGTAVTKQMLADHGKKTPLFDGLDTWFDRVNDYGRQRQLDVQHYIISSGTLEMMIGCSIYSHFEQVYASKFLFNTEGEAVWPSLAINYTNKTQFLFRINKGIDNSWDNTRINRWMPMEERPVPFSHMIFIGDGDTDIPSMKMVRHQGGFSVAVFDPSKWEEEAAQDRIQRLIAEDRVHFVAPADYREGSQLAVTVNGILGRIARDAGYRE